MVGFAVGAVVGAVVGVAKQNRSLYSVAIRVWNAIDEYSDALFTSSTL
jgi:hypothetical protein